MIWVTLILKMLCIKKWDRVSVKCHIFVLLCIEQGVWGFVHSFCVSLPLFVCWLTITIVISGWKQALWLNWTGSKFLDFTGKATLDWIGEVTFRLDWKSSWRGQARTEGQWSQNWRSPFVDWTVKMWTGGANSCIGQWNCGLEKQSPGLYSEIVDWRSNFVDEEQFSGYEAISGIWGSKLWSGNSNGTWKQKLQAE